MMAQSRAESTRDTYNYGQYLNQFPPNTIKVILEFEWIQKKICRHKMSIMFNKIFINEEMLPKYTYIYIYVGVCVCGYIYSFPRYNFFHKINFVNFLKCCWIFYDFLLLPPNGQSRLLKYSKRYSTFKKILSLCQYFSYKNV